MTTESTNGSTDQQTESPATEPVIPAGEPEAGTGGTEELPADPSTGGILPLGSITDELARMTGEIEARFQEMYPGQLGEIEAARDSSVNLTGVHEGWRVDVVVKVRLRRR